MPEGSVVPVCCAGLLETCCAGLPLACCVGLPVTCCCEGLPVTRGAGLPVMCCCSCETASCTVRFFSRLVGKAFMSAMLAEMNSASSS